MEELEDLLRQFQPRRPRPLPDVERLRRKRPVVWIAVSGVAAAIAMIIVQRETTPVAEVPQAGGVTLGALNAHAIKSIEDLDAVLTRTSPAILPDVELPGGALHALSKE
jgi:hypothetical protein